MNKQEIIIKKEPSESMRIPDLFGNMMQGDSERLQIAKELFTPENIDMKTEMSDAEINTFSRAAFIRDIFSLDCLDIYMKQFMRLRVSKTREGRKEFVETVKNQKEDSGIAQIGNLLKAGKI